jgi:DNA-directed RNA polymerase specialized sigma subunit
MIVWDDVSSSSRTWMPRRSLNSTRDHIINAKKVIDRRGMNDPADSRINCEFGRESERAEQALRSLSKQSLVLLLSEETDLNKLPNSMLTSYDADELTYDSPHG